MGEKANAGLKEQEVRRRRINRIKMGIVCSVFIWMLVSIIVCVILFVKVHSLEAQLEALLQDEALSRQIEQPENKAASIKEYDVPATEEIKLAENMDSSAKRTVTANVMSTSDPSNLANEGDVRKVYLTFDDGPSSNTPEILDILDQYGVKATFFVVGKEDEESRALYSRIVSEGAYPGYAFLYP